MPYDALMDRALALAVRGTGQVSPNPRVGCVVVDARGDVAGEGWHGRYGGPHAEVWALREAARRGADVRGGTAVVTLEPCAHTGKTPPCADALVAAGVARVVVGTRDPFGAVDGRGVARLRAAGVEVVEGVRQDACRRLNDAFARHVRTGRPYVVAKVAQTLDGRAAAASGHARWVTGAEARARVHRWRAESDAVVVGHGTALADDPALTVRDADGQTDGPQPLRVVLDRAGTLPATLALFTDAHAARTVAVVADGARPAYADALAARGGRVLAAPLDATGAHLDLSAVVAHLSTDPRVAAMRDGRPLASLFVEAGPGLAAALLATSLVDEWRVFVAPTLVGGPRIALPVPPAATMDAAARLGTHATWEVVGEDVLLTVHAAAPDAYWQDVP